MKRLAAALVAFVAIASGGCHVELLREHPLGCRGDERSLARDTLYFGASIPGGGAVDDAAWRSFETDAIAAAFPSGYTVTDGSGHWRSKDGNEETERTRIVTITHP